VSNATARYLSNWSQRIVVLLGLGYAVGELAQLLGASHDAHTAFSKLVGLALHAMLVIMVIQRRATVASWIRGKNKRGLRTILSDIWAPLAIAVIVGLWVVWALGVDDGFTQMLNYMWRTGLVVLVATVLSILLLGALDRIFYGSGDDDDDDEHTARSQPYHLAAQRVVRVVIMVLAGIALLQVWGLNAVDWFRPGSFGRQLASASVTIFVVSALALVIWEAVNLSITRRIERWTDAGDNVRAVRLRTLVPILRTTLLIVMGLVVLLTVLNELGINIAPLLAGASIIGVALGFGSQKLVQDFITGIFLLMENAMQVGDFVTLAGVSGTVEYLSIRTVRLRASDGVLHVVPFSSVSTVTNNNRGQGNAVVKVLVEADTDIDQAMEAIRQVGKEMREDQKFGAWILNDLELWGVDQVDGGSITLLGQIRSLDSGRWPVQREFNRRIHLRLRELGIRMVNPQARLLERQGRGPADKADTSGKDEPQA
jgi:small-conductance mechanosensitive channel